MTDITPVPFLPLVPFFPLDEGVAAIRSVVNRDGDTELSAAGPNDKP